MLDKIKAFGAWVWNWVTVIVAAATGSIATIIDLLDNIGAIDLTAFFDSETALRITTVVAIVKGVYAFYASKKDA